LTNFELLRLKRQFYRALTKKGQRGGLDASEKCRRQKLCSRDEYGPRMYSVFCRLVGNMYLEFKLIFLKLGIFHFLIAITPNYL